MQSSQNQGKDHFVFCKYDDYVPLFIRGGSIVFSQRTNDILNVRDLNSHYTLYIALDQLSLNSSSLLAQGNFLDIDDYHSEAIVTYPSFQYNRSMSNVYSTIVCSMSLSVSKMETTSFLEYLSKIWRRLETPYSLINWDFMDSLRSFWKKSYFALLTPKILE